MEIKLSPKIANGITEILDGGIPSTIFNLFMGRCTFFAIVYSIVGIYGWLVLNRDLAGFAAFITASQGLLVLHSWKEDVHERFKIIHEEEKINESNRTI